MPIISVVGVGVVVVAAAAITWMLLMLGLLEETMGEKHNKKLPLPPGRLGLPFLGETLEFLGMMQQNRLWRFVEKRVSKYGSSTFKTSLYGWKTVVVASPAGNKMAFASMYTSWPSSIVHALGGQSIIAQNGSKVQRLRNAIHAFLNANALRHYTHPVSLTVLSALSSISSSSSSYPYPSSEFLLYPFVRKLTLTIACRILIGIPHQHSYHESILRHFSTFTRGIVCMPFPFPGTRYSASVSAANAIKQNIQTFIDSKRLELAAAVAPAGTAATSCDAATTTRAQDILTCLLTYEDEDGNPLSDQEIKDNLRLLLFAGADTSSAAISMACRNLAFYPSIMDEVYKENKDVAAALGPGETLRWEDLQKLKLTWRVVQETMRLQPPLEGGFREASADISFDGYTIPKSWKIHWTPNSTRRNPKYFPEPDKFDPSRFEGAGPPPFTFVPFGGGPRMCPGNEFARMEILIIIHYLIIQFSWTLKFPEEHISVDPLPVPVKGLPIFLRPRASCM